MTIINPFITTTNPIITATNPFITTTTLLITTTSQSITTIKPTITICILLLNFQIYLLQVFKITKHALNLIDYFCLCINYAIFQITT